MRVCCINYFTDDTNLLHINKSPKMLNKLINYDMNNLSNWPNANKIMFNVTNTELAIFKPKRKKWTFNSKLN